MSEHSKRTRPCDACRRRKTKCVTEVDNTVCVLCRFHGQECTYDDSPKKRQRPVLRDDSVEYTATAKRSRAVTTRPGTGVEEYDALEGPTLLKRTLGLQNLHHSQYIGANDAVDVYWQSMRFASDRNTPSKPTQPAVKVRLVHPLHAFRIVPDAGTAGHDRETAVLDAIERAVCGNGPELVLLYFRIVHPAFPILHKEVFLEKYARTYREFSPPLLAAVYLLASGYWSFSDTLSTVEKPDFRELGQLARSSLQNAVQRPKLSTVQAALLMSQYQATDAVGANEREIHVLTVQLVDLAYGLGLHFDPSEWDIPGWEVGLRRRLSWAVFVQDKWTALLRGRPSMISVDGWDMDPLTDADFPEHVEDETAGSSEVEKGRLVFMHMASLAVILSAILRDIFGSRFQRSLYLEGNKVTTLLDCVKPLQIQLKEWFANLPDSLKMDTAASMKLSAVGYLRLAYLTVEVCVHRQLLKAMSETEALDATLGNVCRAAARERFTNAIDFVQRLQATHLASFWYFSSSQGCILIHHFGRVLQASAGNVEEKTSLVQKLKEYQWSLKVNSEAGTGFMKHALAVIDQSNHIIFAVDSDRSVTTSPAAARDNSIWQHSRNESHLSDGAYLDLHVNGPELHHSGEHTDLAEDAWHFDMAFAEYADHGGEGLSVYPDEFVMMHPP